MAKQYLGLPFDEDLFVENWQTEPDTVKTALLESGAMQDDATIAEKIATGGNLYSIPFYSVLSGTEVNYDGQTDITADEATGESQTGVVYGRAHGFTARDFSYALSNTDPMGHIVSTVAQFHNKNRQKRIIGILDGIFAITGDTEWAKHTIDLSVKTGTLYKMEATTINNAMTQVLGDNKSAFSAAVMHSTVAMGLENLQVLEYWKQSDANGLQRPVALASCNGLTVIIDDGVPVDTTTDGFPKYTTYLLGDGCLRYAPGKVYNPVGIQRDEAKNGGQETLYTRIRETIHPNGFSFKVPTSGFTESPTDTQLFNKANWARKFDAKAIPMAKIVTNG